MYKGAVKGATREELERRREALLGRLHVVPNLMRGSVYERWHKCGRRSCGCAGDGPKHLTRQLTVTLGGRTQTRYVRVGEVEQVQAWLAAYTELWTSGNPLWCAVRRRTMWRRRCGTSKGDSMTTLRFPGAAQVVLFDKLRPCDDDLRRRYGGKLMRSIFAVLAVLVGLSFLSPTVTEAQFVLYDSFAGSTINPVLWWGNGLFGGPGNPTTESVRLVSAKQLRLAVTQYGSTDTDSGSPTGAMRLSANDDPAGITGMQARVKVTLAETAVCPTNPGAISRVRAQVIGDFFNDGTSTGPGDRTGDIRAGIHKVIDNANSGIISGFIVRCTNAACTITDPLGPFASFTMTWSRNKIHTLTIQWDAPNNQFVFSAKAGSGPAEIHTLSYSVSDTAPAVFPDRSLAAVSSIPNCNGVQLRARMDALFDTVMVTR